MLHSLIHRLSSCNNHREYYVPVYVQILSGFEEPEEGLLLVKNNNNYYSLDTSELLSSSHYSSKVVGLLVRALKKCEDRILSCFILDTISTVPTCTKVILRC